MLIQERMETGVAWGQQKCPVTRKKIFYGISIK
jgi:hypothetical protein